MAHQTISLRDEDATTLLARDIASRLGKRDVILMDGDLGAGKSFFTRALIRHLTHDPDLVVPSPTFTLVQTYEAPTWFISHFDLYRLENPEQIFDIGFEDALASGLTIIEWPEKLGPYRPRAALSITLRSDPHGGPDARIAHLTDTRYDG